MPYTLPDTEGHFGEFGGIYVAETLIPALRELRDCYLECRDDSAFQAELAADYHDYIGRPSPVYLAKRLSEQVGGANIWLKREDVPAR